MTLAPARQLRPMVRKQKPAPVAASAWTFLTNHAHVLVLIAQDPEIRLRDVAERVGITERAVQRIVADLEAAAYLERKRFGRRNHYLVDLEMPVRHPVEANRTRNVGELLALLRAAAHR
jgi:DNA-binding Lrp family transcriptional regulator